MPSAMSMFHRLRRDRRRTPRPPKEPEPGTPGSTPRTSRPTGGHAVQHHAPCEISLGPCRRYCSTRHAAACTGSKSWSWDHRSEGDGRANQADVGAGRGAAENSLAEPRRPPARDIDHDERSAEDASFRHHVTSLHSTRPTAMADAVAESVSSTTRAGPAVAAGRSSHPEPGEGQDAHGPHDKSECRPQQITPRDATMKTAHPRSRQALHSAALDHDVHDLLVPADRNVIEPASSDRACLTTGRTPPRPGSPGKERSRRDGRAHETDVPVHNAWPYPRPGSHCRCAG